MVAVVSTAGKTVGVAAVVSGVVVIASVGVGVAEGGSLPSGVGVRVGVAVGGGPHRPR
jgi:hypothetical protein